MIKKSDLKNNIVVYALLGVFHIWGLICIFIYSKGTFLRWLNSFQSYNADLFFNIITWVGDGYVVCGISLILLLLRKYKLALWSFLAYIGSGILVQIPKRIIRAPRPKTLLEDFNQLNIPMWVNIKGSNSFPSGHTTSAFAMLVFFSLLVENKYLKFLLITLAIIAGISRIYLLQHFLEDVLAGAFIGSISAILLNQYLIKAGKLD